MDDTGSLSDLDDYFGEEDEFNDDDSSDREERDNIKEISFDD